MRASFAALFLLALPGSVLAQAPGILVTGDVPHAVTLSDSALRALPHQTVQVSEHGGPIARYDGVLLRDLLGQAGVDLSAPLRGAALARAVVIEASDGYRVVFAIGELDASIGGKLILLADRKEGQPLDAHEGPYRILAPADGRPARSVRQVTVIRLLEIPPAH